MTEDTGYTMSDGGGSETDMRGTLTGPDGTHTVTASNTTGPVILDCTCGQNRVFDDDADRDELCPHMLAFVMDRAPMALGVVLITRWFLQCLAPRCSFCGKVYETYEQAKLVEGQHRAATICGECREQIRQGHG